MAMRAAFPDTLRFSFKFDPIPVLPLFSGGILDPAEDWIVLGWIPKRFGALCHRAWAMVLLGSDHSDSLRANGLGP